MPRTATKHFKRVTFSFPLSTAETLDRALRGKNKSQYVANLVQADLEKNLALKEHDLNCWFRKFKQRHTIEFDGQEALEVIKEMRNKRDNRIIKSASN